MQYVCFEIYLYIDLYFIEIVLEIELLVLSSTVKFTAPGHKLWKGSEDISMTLD